VFTKRLLEERSIWGGDPASTVLICENDGNLGCAYSFGGRALSSTATRERVLRI